MSQLRALIKRELKSLQPKLDQERCGVKLEDTELILKLASW